MSSEHIFLLFVPPRLLAMRRHKIANNATLHKLLLHYGGMPPPTGMYQGTQLGGLSAGAQFGYLSAREASP
jgi:hypothetical protein